MIAKKPEEIEALREGGRRLARHVRTLAKMVKSGITSRALEDAARAMVEKDGDEPAFLGYKDRREKHGYPSALCVSVNDVIVHSPAAENNVVIQEGDIVCLDFGIKHKGLYTDHATTVIAGNALNPHDEELVCGTKEALAAGIKEAKIGNTTGDIGYAVEQVAIKYGFGFPRNLSGHGVGKEVHEEPHVPNFGDKGKGVKLVDGLVIAIEPMMALGSGELYVADDGHSYKTKDGSRTAHFEHTILI
ncbi:MAG: type I methionyl aminopeptidase, partial [bacterium]|nr:type I methionyl aminopeptidase [bacterium]